MTETEAAHLVPFEEKGIDFYGDTIYAALVQTEEGEQVYVPIKPISDALGLDWSAQFRRIRRDPELSEVSELIAMTAINPNPRGGRPDTLALPLEFLAGWLFGVQTNRIREELREKVRRYKLECYRVLSAHFQGESVTRLESTNTLSQVRGLALAIAQMAEQQMALEQEVEVVDAKATTALARMDRAAEVVMAINRRLGAVESRLTPGAYIQDEQAQEIATQVKALAELLTSREGGKNFYQGIFAELYRRFGVSSYKLIRQEQYEAVLQFLEEWRTTITKD